MRIRFVVVTALAVAPAVAAAQERTSSYTQMLLGFGPTPSGTAAIAGFEHRLKSSPVGFRIMADFVDHTRTPPDADESYPLWSRMGVSVLGMRYFRSERRVQPYLLAGVGVFNEWGSQRQLLSTQSGSGPITYSYGPIEYYERTNFGATWGAGTSVRLGPATVFGELKLRLVAKPSRLTTGFFIPFTFGIRF
jgi:hypothetical protein